MKVCLREWTSYRKSIMLWSIGLIILVGISFYKVDGMSGMPGGMNAMLETLPPAFQAIFGVGYDYTTGIGLYSFIHLYILIALSFHAALLGADIFAKEEHDKTFEFLYVKPIKRSRIFILKIFTAISILLCLNIICNITVFVSLAILGKSAMFMDMLPFILGIFLAQGFFFSLTFLFTLLLPNNRKAGMLGCIIILCMFLITMYTKLGGTIEFLNSISIFYYMDASQLIKGMDILVFGIVSIICVLCGLSTLFRTII